ncbi:MAG TPA: hypothetical protein VG889_04215 [Rhizomicrobium sp.]|nr:hypothetical protein [Rhizomicrobium sp.]
MFRALFSASVLAFAPVTAQAFESCAATALAKPGSDVAEEGSNPVLFDGWIYGGYVQNTKVFVFANKDGAAAGTPFVLYQGGRSFNLRLAAAGKSVYATWIQGDKGDLHLMFAVSHKHGAAGSWSTPAALTPSAHNLQQISADGHRIHIAYLTEDANVAVLNSIDGGHSFLAPVIVGAGWGEIVVSGLAQDVYVSWNVKRTDKIFDVMSAVSNDGGKTFTTPANMTASRPGGAVEPILYIDHKSKRVSLVWRENGPILGYYLRSTDRGHAWSAPLAVGSAPARQYMVVDDGKTIYVSYLVEAKIGTTPDWQIYLATSSDGGTSFTPGTNLSGPTGISALFNDDERPMPWTGHKGVFRLTAVEADGVYEWEGKNGTIAGPTFLGPGKLASPAGNASVWLGPNKIATYGVCR